MKAINSTQLMAMRQDIIAQNDALKKVANPSWNGSADGSQPAFGAAMVSAFKEINEIQRAAGDITQDYTMGKTNDIAAVMMAKQKSSLGFELTLQVRNKLIKAYQDIMTMPV